MIGERRSPTHVFLSLCLDLTGVEPTNITKKAHSHGNIEVAVFQMTLEYFKEATQTKLNTVVLAYQFVIVS